MNKEEKEFEQKIKEEFGAEVGEDATQYGEFISSYFAWVPLEKQKEKVERLQKITKKKKTDWTLRNVPKVQSILKRKEKVR
mgnify:FL=1